VSDIGAARNTDPDTSHEAAWSVNATAMEELVFTIVLCFRLDYSPPGVTTSEAVAISGKEWNSISPRFRPLARKCRIVDTGKRRKNPATGRNQIVWDLSPAEKTKRGIK
jgi:hypothetical protein